MKRIKIKDILKSGVAGQTVVAKGWVRTKRGSKNVIFIALNDGSTIHNLQVVAEVSNFDESLLREINTSAALSVTGTLVESAGSGQNIELTATEIELLGAADPEKYPIQPKKHSLEFLRENAHLRFRTSTFSAIFRIRHAMAFAIHKYFNEKGFNYLHTPIITGSDAEGAGQMFRVSVLDPKNPPLTEQAKLITARIFLVSPPILQFLVSWKVNLALWLWAKFILSGQLSGRKLKYNPPPCRVLDD